MALPLTALGLNAVSPMVDNYEQAWHPIKRNVKKIPIGRRNRKGQPQQDQVYEEQTPEQKGWILKSRKEVGSDEEIVQVVGKKSQVKGNELVPRRPGGGMTRRASSVDRGSKQYRWAKGGAAELGDSSDEDTHGRSRRGRQSSGKSNVSGRSRGNTTELRSQSSSGSSVCSSSEDEHNMKKMRRKKWITAGFASVATIHAAQKVYTSLEARDKRAIEVASGKLSPEDATKKQNTARWQDAAAVGIAALSLKGAYGEWHEMAEHRTEYKNQQKEKEERHRKRVERAQRAKELGVDYKDILHPHSSGYAQRSKSARRPRSGSDS